MQVRVFKWGDDLAVPLPDDIVDKLRLAAGDNLSLSVEAGTVQLSQASAIPHYRLADLVAEADRLLGPENEPESVDWGPDVGAEIIDDEYSRGG